MSACRGLQLFVAEVLNPRRLVANQLGLRNRKTRLLGDRHGVSPLGLELLLQGGVLLDGFEELREVFLGHGSLG